MNSMKLFTGRAHPALAKKICEYLGLPLGRAIMGDFPDGEISCKIDEDVRGRDDEGRDELADLEEKIAKTKLSKEAREKAQHELKKLRQAFYLARCQAYMNYEHEKDAWAAGGALPSRLGPNWRTKAV